MPATVESILAAPPIDRRTDYIEHPQWRANAAIRALRDTGRHQALLQDTAPVNVEGRNYYGGAMGVYEPGIDWVTLANKAYTEQSRDQPITVSQPGMENTAAHELTHALQGPERRAPIVEKQARRESPTSFTNDMIRLFSGPTGIAANQWRDLLRGSRENYGPGELGARFASELGYGPDPRSDVVKQAYEQYPGLSMVFAQQNMQPNRPFPRHAKGEPEWTKAERKHFEKTGEPPYYSTDELVDIQQARIKALRGQ